MWLFLIIFAVLIIVAFTRLTKLGEQISSLEKRITMLEKKGMIRSDAIRDTSLQPQAGPDEKCIEKEHAHVEKGTAAEWTWQSKRITDQPDITRIKDQPQERVKEVSPGEEVWKKIRNRFEENWTGIIGAVVLVMGVSFIGIYAALFLKPFYRFSMIILFAAGLFIVSLVMKRKPEWVNPATWIRSCSGAIILFACLGSGWIDGLKWIDDVRYAVIFLSLGITVNLYFGFLGGTQAFASLHVILSLIALGIAPQNRITLIISGLIALVGIGFAYRDRWDRHLLLTIIASLIYHLDWYGSMGFSGSGTIPLPMRLTGIITLGTVGFSACLLHYRKLYASKEFDRLPFACHMTNWAFLAIGFLLYSTGSKWNTPVLAAASCALFLLAGRARTKGIRWLHITDRLVAQSIAIFALFTLGRWGLDTLFITAAIYLEILVFAYVMIEEGDAVFKWLGVYLHLLAACVVISVGTFTLMVSGHADVVRNSIILSGVLCLHVFFHLYTKEKPLGSSSIFDVKGDETEVTISGTLVGPLMLVVYAYLYRYVWANYALAVAGSLLLFTRQRVQSNGLGTGLIIALLGSGIFAWVYMWNDIPRVEFIVLLYAIPLLLLSLAATKWSYVETFKKFIVWPGIYLFSAHLIFTCYIMMNHISPFLPGVCWLIISVLYLEAATRVKEKVAQPVVALPVAFEAHLLHVGYALIGLFIVRHVAVHMQSELYVGLVKIRLLIELFAIIVFLYWATFEPPERIKTGPSWYAVHPFFWELVLASTVFTIALEVPVRWHPCAWTLLAGLLLGLGNRFQEHLSRMRLYSLILYWAGVLQLAVISTTYRTPSLKWADQAWVAGCIAMIGLFIYVPLYHRRGRLSEISLSFGAEDRQQAIRHMAERHNFLLFYPLFTSVALFLYWSFDKSILTLLWVTETFMIFVISIILRESHFRYLSMVGLVGCLLRLLFYDLSRSSTLMRAIVFIGVGLLMLAMNTLYTKYKERF